MTLNPPTKIIFLISLIIAIIAIVAALNMLSFIPFPAFWIMTIAYILLSAGVIFRGI